MALTPKLIDSLIERGYTRRNIAKIALGAGAAIPFFNEFAQAQDAEERVTRGGGAGAARPYDPEAVVISSNENPMGPTPEGIAAMAKVGPLGWRYRPQGENLEFEKLLASVENVPQDHVNGYAG
jgi:histidinol-phosphate aminotransferase